MIAVTINSQGNPRMVILLLEALTSRFCEVGTDRRGDARHALSQTIQV